jgi:hypothetical protein
MMEVGPWRLLELRSCGAYGAVYRAEPLGLPGSDPFALKHYRSPEALRFHWRFWDTPGARYEPGPADDLYSLGITAFRLVTGGYPPPLVPPMVLERDPSFPTPFSVFPEDLVTVYLELARIIRQLLSEDPSARGTAAQVAEALEHAARTAGPQADEPILPRPAPASAKRKSQPGPSRPMGARWPWIAAAAGVAGALAVQGAWDARRKAPVPPPEELTRLERDRDMEDAGTSLAQEMLMLSAREEQPEPTLKGLTVEVPKKPLPGQARPPCRRSEAEINGGCWGRPEVSKPPCRERDFEWRKGCYYPVIVPAPPTTSEPR